MAAAIKDSAGFCQPLATISKVGIDIQLGETSNAMVMANSLRLQQV